MAAATGTARARFIFDSEARAGGQKANPFTIPGRRARGALALTSKRTSAPTQHRVSITKQAEGTTGACQYRVRLGPCVFPATSCSCSVCQAKIKSRLPTGKRTITTGLEPVTT